MGVESWAQTANATEHIPSAKLPTQIPRANLPFINWRAASTPADLADRTAVGPVGYAITADLVFNDTQYKAGEQVVKTAQGAFYRIVKVTQEDVPDIESDVTQYKLIAVAESPRRDIIYQPAQAGTTLTAQWRGGPGLGAIANTQGRTANDINAEILEWYYADSGRIFHLYTRQPGQGGTAWDTLYINGTAYSLTAAGVNQGTGTPPHGSATGTTGIYYRLVLPANPVIGGRVSINLEDNEASPGDRFFVGNPRQEQRLVAQATSIQHGMRFPTSPVNDELFLLPTDGAPGTYTDEDGNEQTSALSGDIFQYSHTTARWTRIYTNQHRPIPSATVGNTDPFPVGANNKIAFERAPQDGLPTYAARLANSIILNSDGRPIVYTGGQQIPLAFDADVLHRGEAPFPARQALIERERDDVRFQTEEHVAAVRLDQTMTFGAWTLADWSGNTPGQHVYNNSRVRSSTVPNEDIASITYYSQNYYDQNLRGRFVLRYHGDAGENFGPLNLKLYLASSTNPRGEEVTLALVKERTYWKTAVQVPDTFRPETGAGGDVVTRTRTGGNAIQYNVENGSDNFEFLTEESIVIRYVPEDNLGRHVRGRIVWEANPQTIALWGNDASESNYWRVSGDGFGANAFVAGSLRDGIRLTPFVQIHGRTGLIFSHLSIWSDDLKALQRLGSNAPDDIDERAMTGATSITETQIRARAELLSPSQTQNHWGADANCFRVEVFGQANFWFGIWVSNRLAFGTDHSDYMVAGSRFGFIGTGY